MNFYHGQALEEVWLAQTSYVTGDDISIADLLMACELEQVGDLEHNMSGLCLPVSSLTGLCLLQRDLIFLVTCNPQLVMLGAAAAEVKDLQVLTPQRSRAQL